MEINKIVTEAFRATFRAHPARETDAALALHSARETASELIPAGVTGEFDEEEIRFTADDPDLESESIALEDDDAEEMAQRLASHLLASGADEFSDEDWSAARGIYDQSARERRLSAMRRVEIQISDAMEIRMSVADAIAWARSADMGDYLIRYEDTGLSHAEDPGSRCGFGDDELDEISAVLRARGMRLTADDQGLVAQAAE